MRIGLDFGTTNSGAALFDGQRVRVFHLDPASRNRGVVRSLLYITREHEVFIGQAALDAYYRQNVGRPMRMVRRRIGEIEITASEMSITQDVHVLMDELTPGRLLRSLKSSLATGYEGTDIFGRYYTLEALIALYLRTLRERAEAEVGQPVESVVLGRPVTFVGSGDGGRGERAANRRAEDRLRQAAHMAGFHQVTFEFEPVAAALHYELTAQHPQNVVVFDFGGGTLDMTVMRVGGLAGRRVFATGGVGIAGDVFDQRIIERLLLEHFGRGSTLRSGLGDGDRADGPRNGLPFPDKYTAPLVHWQTIPEMNRPQTLRFLEQAQVLGSHPSRVQALESLLVNNYAIRMIDQVERAKIALSTDCFATIELIGEDINVWQPITRSQFEALIADAVRRIEACLLDTIERSELTVGQIDAVVRTGGSAQIPCFIEMMERIFGPQKVTLSSVFSGVTSGLAIRAAA